MKRLRTLFTAAVCAAGLGLGSGWDVTTASTLPDPGQPGEPLDLGLAAITLVGPATTGAGDRPSFVWEPVEGAASYSLAIVADVGAEDGDPLWAWYGTTTEVILGGWPVAPIAGAPGPALLGQSEWFVVAFDAGGVPIANSVVRPVAP